MIESSELIVNPDGSIYHLKLRPEQLADTVILVGDLGRVSTVSAHFDSVEFRIQNREFITHTGLYRGKRISVISTGIGTDNIDIVLNELDALVNIDLEKREVRAQKKSLRLVRIGTSGSLQEDIPVDSFVLSTHAVGFDGVLPFYQFTNTNDENALTEAFCRHTDWPAELNPPYVFASPGQVFHSLKENMITGITATANGFYGPQGRVLRLPVRVNNMNEKLHLFSHNELRICNYEMETSALYGLASLLGHEAATVCAIIANRYRKEYSRDYHTTIEKLTGTVLDRLTR